MAKMLSTFAIAKMLSVDPGSVANWIDQELLDAHRTPGGHRRVSEEDLIRFLRAHKMPIPQELQAPPPKVVVVDDEPAVAQMIVRAIKSANPEYEVIEANDGFSAGTLIASEVPDVVLLDLRMPGMDGFEVCRQIKAQDSTRHVSVLAMTAYPSPESEKRILDCGAKACLAKPLDIETLLQQVKAAL